MAESITAHRPRGRAQPIATQQFLHDNLKSFIASIRFFHQQLDIMHHLHPRSRTTSTLFTTTLAISFLVVGAPHLLPCPVDRRQYADSFETPDGKRYRRKRKDVTSEATETQETHVAESGNAALSQDERPKRECPVPKPGGLVGQLLGFKSDRPKPVEVVVQPLETKRAKQTQQAADDAP